jgi:hypothetical protein
VVAFKKRGGLQWNPMYGTALMLQYLCVTLYFEPILNASYGPLPRLGTFQAPSRFHLAG